MAMDKDKIKQALDSFENDNYTDSRDILSKEIRKAKNDFLKDKLGLKNEIDGEEE